MARRSAVVPFDNTNRRWIVRTVPLVILAWCFWSIIVASGHRGAYYPYSRIHDDFHCPVGSVVVSLALITGEAFLADWLLFHRGRPRLWRRALPMAACMLPISWNAFLGSMHAPPYVFYHEVWLVLFNAFLALLAILSLSFHFGMVVKKGFRGSK